MFPILSTGYEEQSFLTGFVGESNIHPERAESAVKIVEIIAKTLVESSLAKHPLLDQTLTKRALIFQGTSSEPINAVAMEALTEEANQKVVNDERKFNSIIAKEYHLKESEKVCQEMLLGVSSQGIVPFIATVEEFYHKALSEGASLKDALTLALAKGMVRSMVKIPSNDEIDSDTELKEKIESDAGFKPYECAITGDLVGSDAVYLRVDQNHNPLERYHKKEIEDWIRQNGTDPITREFRTLDDVKADYRGREFIESRLFSLFYPELEAGSSFSKEVKNLEDKSFLVAVSAAYPLVKDEYLRILERSNNTHLAIKGAESFARETVSRFISLVGRPVLNVLDENRQKIMNSSCVPFIEEFIRQAGERLDTVEADLIRKIRSFVTCFYEVNAVQMSPSSKKQILTMIGDEISKEAPLTKVLEIIEEYKIRVDTLVKQEEKIRRDFPGFLQGKGEWDLCLGEVAQVPIPEGIWDIANQPCPITPDKKVWETHMMVLIPNQVNGQPLTMNSLGELIKDKGHFPGKATGYDYIGASVATEHGNRSTGPSRFVLMTRDVLPESRHKSCVEQVSMVTALSETTGSGYRIPYALEAAACIYMNYLSSGTRLYNDSPWTYTRCLETAGGHPVIVGGFVPKGLRVVNHVLDNRCNGVSALRQL